MDLIKHNPQAFPHSPSLFQHRDHNLWGSGKEKGSSSQKNIQSQNKIEVTLEELSAFFGEKAKVFYSKKYSQNGLKNRKIQEFKVKSIPASVSAVSQKASTHLQKLGNARSVRQVWAILESAGSLFKGMALSHIPNPVLRALATIFTDSVADKQSAMAYVVYQVFSGSLSLNKRSRRNKMLGIRLLKKMVPSGTDLEAISKRLSSRRGRTRDFESIKKELYLLAQGFEAEGYYNPERGFSQSPSNGSSEKLHSVAKQVSPPAYAKDSRGNIAPRNIHHAEGQNPRNPSNVGSVPMVPSPPALTGVNNPSASRGPIPIPPPPGINKRANHSGVIVPSAPALTGVNNPSASSGPIPIPPPPPPFGANKGQLPPLPTVNKGGRAQSGQTKPKHSTPPKTIAEQIKNPSEITPNAVVSEANHIIEFNNTSKRIVSGIKILPSEISSVDPKIIGNLNFAQLSALPAYYWASLTDKQQEALNPEAMRQAIKAISDDGLRNFTSSSLKLTDKAKNLNLQLACLSRDNIIKVLKNVKNDDPSYNYIHTILINKQLAEGSNFDKNREKVIKALAYEPQAGEEIDRVSVAMLDGFYDKIPAKPARPQVGGAQSSTKQSLVSAWEKVFIPSNIQRLMDQPKPNIFDEIKYKKQVKEYKENNPDIFSSDEWIAQLPQDIQANLKKARPQPSVVKAAIDFLRANPGILLSSKWMELLPPDMLNEKQGLEQGIQNGSLDKASQAVKDFVKKACECKRDHPADFIERVAQNTSQERPSESSSLGSQNARLPSQRSSLNLRPNNRNANAGRDGQSSQAKLLEDYKVGDDISHLSIIDRVKVKHRWAEAEAKRKEQEETDRLNSQPAEDGSDRYSFSYTGSENYTDNRSLNPGSYHHQGYGQEYGEDEPTEYNSGYSGTIPTITTGKDLVPLKELPDGSTIYLTPRVSAKNMSQVSLGAIKELKIDQLFKLRPDHLAYMTREQQEALSPFLVYQLAKSALEKVSQQQNKNQSKDAKARLVYLDRALVIQKVREHESELKSKLSRMERQLYKDTSTDDIQDLYREVFKQHNLPEHTSCLGISQLSTGKLNIAGQGQSVLEQIKNMPKVEPIDPTANPLGKAENSGQEPAATLDNPEKAVTFFNTIQRATIVSKVLNSERWKELVNDSIEKINKKREAVNTELLRDYPVDQYPRAKNPKLDFKQLSSSDIKNIKDKFRCEAQVEFNESYQSRVNVNEKNRYELEFEKAIQECFDAYALPLGADEATRETYFKDLQHRLGQVLEEKVQTTLEKILKSLVVGEQSRIDREKDQLIDELSGYNLAHKMNFRNGGLYDSDSDDDDDFWD